MIVWVSGPAVGMPCDQRARVLEATPERVLIELQGNGFVKTIKPAAIVGLELSGNVDIKFSITRICNHQAKGLRPHPAVA